MMVGAARTDLSKLLSHGLGKCNNKRQFRFLHDTNFSENPYLGLNKGVIQDYIYSVASLFRVLI